MGKSWRTSPAPFSSWFLDSKENLARKVKKEHREDQEESALVEILVHMDLKDKKASWDVTEKSAPVELKG